ncbi:hypothetical protein TNCV_2633291 [Trichonephila clavipes]|nr:hypothetical protein TNCV_2633291 [Trichonephila clavipes]
MWNVTDWQKVVFSDESRFVLGQMITVYGCGGSMQDNARPHTARVAPDFPTSFSDASVAGPLPRFVPCRERVESAKNGRCHRVTLYMI